MKDVLIWAGMWVIAFVLIYGIRPKRKNRRLDTYKPADDTRETLRFWKNSWRA